MFRTPRQTPLWHLKKIISLLFSLLCVLLLFDTHLICCNPVVNSWLKHNAWCADMLSVTFQDSSFQLLLNAKLKNRLPRGLINVILLCRHESTLQRSCISKDHARCQQLTFFFHIPYVTFFFLTHIHTPSFPLSCFSFPHLLFLSRVV